MNLEQCATSRSRHLLVLATAVLFIAIFPRIDFGWLAFVCLVPLLLLVPYRSPIQLFRSFWFAAFLFRLGNLYWIAMVIQHYTSVPMILAAGIVVLLGMFLGLFWGITGAVLGWVSRRRGFASAMLLAPFVWVIQEAGLNWVQFPWDLLGYSQYAHPRFAQAASILGVYGLTWILVAFNAALALWIVARERRYAYSIIVIVLVFVFYGHWRIAQPAGEGSVKVGLIQGNIPQDVKIDYEFADSINRKHIRMTDELVKKEHPDIVLWSESSTLFPILSGGEWARQVLETAKRNQVPVLIGSDRYTQDQTFNSAFLVKSDGSLEPQTYSKIYLVPFGEFVPFSKLLFFAGKVVPEISDFTHGYDYTLFPLKGKSFAVNICFEVVFPQLARRLCHNGAGLLTTITNDAWFGRTCAPYQHFGMAVMRAIENRRYLVRVANTGISGFVDPYGRVLQKSDIFTTAEMAGEIKWVQEQTFYTRHGDLILYISAVVLLAGLILSLFTGKLSTDGRAVTQK